MKFEESTVNLGVIYRPIRVGIVFDFQRYISETARDRAQVTVNR